MEGVFKAAEEGGEGGGGEGLFMSLRVLYLFLFLFLFFFSCYFWGCHDMPTSARLSQLRHLEFCNSVQEDTMHWVGTLSASS